MVDVRNCAGRGAHMAEGSISPQLDELSSILMGQAFDVLAAGRDVNVLLAVADAAGNVASYTFADDGPEECLEGARKKVRDLARSCGDAAAKLGAPVRYALAYEGAVADERGAYQDAVLLEFGERGRTSFSAFSLVDGKGEGDNFAWTDPAPAGEVENLLG